MKTSNIIIGLSLLTVTSLAQENADRQNKTSGRQSGSPVAQSTDWSSDQKFAWEAACSGMKEVTLSQIALRNSNNAEVRRFAQMMVTDHTEANSRLTQIASRKDLQLPQAGSFASGGSSETGATRQGKENRDSNTTGREGWTDTGENQDRQGARNTVTSRQQAGTGSYSSTNSLETGATRQGKETRDLTRTGREDWNTEGQASKDNSTAQQRAGTGSYSSTNSFGTGANRQGNENQSNTTGRDSGNAGEYANNQRNQNNSAAQQRTGTGSYSSTNSFGTGANRQGGDHQSTQSGHESGTAGNTGGQWNSHSPASATQAERQEYATERTKTLDTIRQLENASGETFDRLYVKQMTEDHTKAVSKFEAASQNLKDAELKQFALSTLPTLRQHLDHAKRLDPASPNAANR